MQIKDSCTILLTFFVVLVCHVSSKDLFSTNQDSDSGVIDDLDIISDDRSKRTNYRTLNDFEAQSSQSLPYKASGSFSPRQLRQSPYFALRGKRMPSDEYSNIDDNGLFNNEEDIRNIPSYFQQSRNKRMISALAFLDPRYMSMMRRILDESMKMSNEKAKDVSMDKRQHYRFHALRG